MVGAALALAVGVARASGPEVVGLGSRESALAGASTARAGDFSAAHYNPAGLAAVRSPEATVGLVGFGSTLTATLGDGTRRTMEIADPLLLLVGGATPLPLGGPLAERLYVGIALAIPPAGLVRVIAEAPDAPQFALYNNRTQRLVVLPALAARLGPVSLGVGVNYLAGLAGRVSGAPGPDRALEARVDEAIGARAAVHVGLRARATRALTLGIVYRQEFSVPFATTANTRVAGQPIDLDVRAQALFTPHTLVAGGALALPWWRVVLSLDVGWAHWSAWRGPFVAVESALPLVGDIVAPPPRVRADDTAIVRGGLEWTAVERRFTKLQLRGGYGFESRAVSPAQPGVTNLLDGHKHRLAAGMGIVFPLGPLTVRGDGHGTLELLQPETIEKRAVPAGTTPRPPADEALVEDQPNPGWPRIRGEGLVWAFGLTITVQLR